MANLWQQLMEQTRRAQLMQQGVPSGNPLDRGSIIGGLPPGTIDESGAMRTYDPDVDGPPVQDATPEILVRGGRPQMDSPASVDPSQYLLDAPPSMGNSAYLEERHAVNDANEKSGKQRHKGMFGLKGTLRDVLGTLGDAFLVQGGGDAVYAPQRQRERVSDAMAGHTAAPMAAAERVTQYDPDLGTKVAQQAHAAQVARAQQQVTAQQQAAARYAQGIKIFGGMMGASNAETYERMKPKLEAIRKMYGLDEFDVPDTYDPNYAATIAQGSMDTSRQITARQGDARLAQGDDRIEISRGQLGVAQGRAAETARHNRETESAARARIAKMGGGSSARARADTPLEYFRALEDIPPEKRSAEENAWVRKYTGQNSSSGRSGRGGGSAPRSSRFRMLNK